MTRISVIFLLFLLLSCMKSRVIDTVSSDYFPNDNGNTWTLVNDAHDTLFIRIAGDTTLAGDSAKVVEFLGNVEIWDFETPIIEKYVLVKAYREGEEIELIDETIEFMPLRPIEGDSLFRSLRGEMVVQGDTFRASYTTSYIVREEKQIETPSGTYSAYEVDLLEHLTLTSPYFVEDTFISMVMYLAPDVGPVRMVLTGMEHPIYNLLKFERGL